MSNPEPTEQQIIDSAVAAELAAQEADTLRCNQLAAALVSDFYDPDEMDAHQFLIALTMAAANVANTCKVERSKYRTLAMRTYDDVREALQVEVSKQR